MTTLELVPISILCPTYNRSKFLPLFTNNLQLTNYPKDKLELVIDDDGTEPFIVDMEQFKRDIHPIKVNYLRYPQRRTIGDKRNNLVKKSSNKIVVFMDDDDIYHPDYIPYSYTALKVNKAGIVGSNQMIFIFPEDNWLITGIQCEKKFQMHEATMMMTKKYFRAMQGFGRTSQGEGASIIQLQDKNVFITDIRFCMICVGHDGNTISKDDFKNSTSMENPAVMELPQVEILKTILGI